jgi:hypothetical protein
MVEQLTLQTLIFFIQAVGILVGVTYHIMTLRNTRKNQELTLETRQAQMFMQMYNRYMDSLEGVDHIDVIQNSKFDSVGEYEELVESDEKFSRVYRAYGSFYEGLGVLVKEGLLNVRLVALMWGGPTRMFWEKIAPILAEYRVYIRYPRLWSETEYVCREVLRYMEEHPELKT